MKTKIFTLFVAIFCTTTIFATEFEVDGIKYYNTLGGDSVAVGGKSYSGDIIIPASVVYENQTYRVTSIGRSAFDYCDSLTSINIANGITSIGERAFECCFNLTSITIPESVITIGEKAFCSCNSLTSITIPNSATVIGDAAFTDCNRLSSPVYNATIFAYMPTSYSGSYTIPDGIQQIAGGAFYGCTGLTSVTIPNSVTSIGHDAFMDCSGLTSVTLPNSVTEIGYAAFWGTTETPIYNANCFAYLPRSYQGSYSIPDGITKITGGAFFKCKNLTSVTIPNSVTSISSNAFGHCSGLTSVNLPNSVTLIDDHRIFSECDSLLTPVYNTYYFVYMPCSYSGSYSIPDGIQQIGVEAFSECTTLTSIVVPQSINKIGRYAFPSNISIKFEGIVPPNIDDTDNINANPVSVPCGAAVAYKNAGITATETYGDVFPYKLTVLADTLGMAAITQQPDCLTQEAIVTATPTTYGYRFSHWSDGNTNNPRTYVVTKDDTISAIFEKSRFFITANATDGVVQGASRYYYLDTCILKVTPNLGFQFTQWSDGCTDNPRTFVVECDSVFTAQLVQLDTITGQIGDNLYFTLIDGNVVITGNGEMWNYSRSRSPFYRFREQIKTVTLPEGLTSVGQYVFYNCNNLNSVSIPNSVTEIGSNAFYNVMNINYNGTCTNYFPWGALHFNGYNTQKESIAIYQNCDSLPPVPNPGAGKTTIAVYVPDNTTEYGCYAVGTVNSWNETDLQTCRFQKLEGRWYALTVEYAADMQLKVCAIPSDTTLAGWSYQWAKNVDLEDAYCPETVDHVIILQGTGELTYENGGQPKLVSLEDNGVVYISIKAWAADPIIKDEPATTAAIKHPWNGGDWKYFEMEKVNDTAFTYNARYGAVGCNIALDVDGAQEVWYSTDQLIFDAETEYAVGDSVQFRFTSRRGTRGSVEVKMIEKAEHAQYNKVDKARCISSLTLPQKRLTKAIDATLTLKTKMCGEILSCNYADSTVVMLHAIPNNDHVFVRWSDGNTSNPRIFTVTNDTTLTAIFDDDEEADDGKTEDDNTENEDNIIHNGDLAITPTETTALFAWPAIENAYSYSLIIWANAEQTEKVCTLTFNSNGQLTGIDFSKAPNKAPSENNSGLNFKVTGLEPGTTYAYTLDALDENGAIIDRKTGTFLTEGATAVENVQIVNLYVENGRIICENAEDLRIYTITGIDVTHENGHLQGVYIVKCGERTTKVVVK